jgi:hypothetical protein
VRLSAGERTDLDGDYQHITQLACAPEQIDMAGMQDIETAIRENDFLPELWRTRVCSATDS